MAQPFQRGDPEQAADVDVGHDLRARPPAVRLRAVQAMVAVLRGSSGSVPPPGRTRPFSPDAAYGFGLQGWQLTITLELILVALCVLGTVLFLRERRRLRVRSA